MVCYFCGAETTDRVETDLPLGRGLRLEYKEIGICRKKRCQRKLERRLNRNTAGEPCGHLQVAIAKGGCALYGVSSRRGKPGSLI